MESLFLKVKSVARRSYEEEKHEFFSIKMYRLYDRVKGNKMVISNRYHPIISKHIIGRKPLPTSRDLHYYKENEVCACHNDSLSLLSKNRIIPIKGDSERYHCDNSEEYYYQFFGYLVNYAIFFETYEEAEKAYERFLPSLTWIEAVLNKYRILDVTTRRSIYMSLFYESCMNKFSWDFLFDICYQHFINIFNDAGKLGDFFDEEKKVVLPEVAANMALDKYVFPHNSLGFVINPKKVKEYKRNQIAEMINGDIKDEKIKDYLGL